jgi:hypothetical protein
MNRPSVRLEQVLNMELSMPAAIASALMPIDFTHRITGCAEELDLARRPLPAGVLGGDEVALVLRLNERVARAGRSGIPTTSPSRTRLLGLGEAVFGRAYTGRLPFMQNAATSPATLYWVFQS